MSKQKIRQICESIQKDYINKMCDLCEDERYEDATALYEEIKEWLTEKEESKILTIKRPTTDKNLKY